VLILLFSPVLAHGADLAVGVGQPYVTLSDAMDDAVTGDRLLVDPGTYSEDEIVVQNKTVSIEPAQGPGTVTVVLASGDNLFELKNGADLTLRDLDLDGASQGRLANVRSASLAVVGCQAINVAPPALLANGGAVDVFNGTLTVEGSTLSGAGVSAESGGLIHARRGTVDLNASVLQQGVATQGGAISGSFDSDITVRASSFLYNTADTGSVLHASGGNTVIQSSILDQNTATTGTVVCDATDLCEISTGLISDNSAETGGVVVSDSAVTTLSGTSICGASLGSRLVDLSGADATLSHTVFYGADLSGALVFVGPGASALILNNHFVGSASTSGAAALRVEGIATFTNNLVAFNTGVGATLEAATGTLDDSYNLFYANLDAHADVSLDPTSLVDVDPLLTGVPMVGSCDLAALVPTAYSPAIDAGDPTRFDDDGTVADIGAFGNLMGNPVTDGDDDDGDGVPSPGDCNDLDPAIYPGADEIGCNGIDDDCDPLTSDLVDEDGDGTSVCLGDCDDTDPDRTDLTMVFRDADMDGFGVGQAVELCGIPFDGSDADGDCDDQDASVYPGAEEVLYDGIDQDCDGFDLDDVDGDGATGPEDCDDTDPERYPNAKDVPGDGIDQDCNDWDAGSQLIGGAGFSCGGCSATGSSTGLSWWLLGLGLALRARRRHSTPAP